MREEGAQNTRIWRLRTTALGSRGLRQAAMRASAPRSPHHLGYQLRTWAGTRTGGPSGAQVPSGRLFHASARLRPRPRPDGRLPGRDPAAHGPRSARPRAVARLGERPPVAARVVSGVAGRPQRGARSEEGCDVGAGMAARVPVDRASPADLMQLATDVGPAPMHVGAVLVLGTGPGFSVQDAQRLLGDRVRAVPRLRQRLRRAPPGCGRPFWADDPAFDLRCGPPRSSPAWPTAAPGWSSS